MSKKSNSVQLNKYDKATEACPKMTRRWRREVCWELATWLTVHLVRARRALSHAGQVSAASPTAAADALVEVMKCREALLIDLIRSVPHKWDDYLWWECVKEVEGVMDFGPGKPTHTPTIPGIIKEPVKPKG